ncbi:MAG: YaiO family outer membrane beta-barrel protein [Bacteroidota bacterium]|nr:YaiO family outer membrane beta-barrel protein [Bacteroidota bacterium]
MKSRLYIKHLSLTAIILVQLILSSSILMGQEKVNLDSLFFKARDYYRQQKYDSVRLLSNEILLIDENYYDARVLLGRTMAHAQELDSAATEYTSIITEKPGYWDAVDGMIDLEMNRGNLDTALYFSKYGLTYHPNDEYFLLKKAKIQMRMGDYDESQRTILQILDRNASSAEAAALLDEIKQVNILNYVALDYDFEYFKIPWVRRWHLLHLSYLRQTRYGSIIGKIYFGDLVRENESIFSKETGVAFEVQAYPQFSKKTYGWVSVFYSPSTRVFQRWRTSVEVYQSLPWTLEASLGVRYINFVEPDGTYDGLFIYTGSIGKYYKDWWFSFRPYIIPKSYGTDNTYLLRIRRYFNSADNFVLLDLSTGIIPDDPINYPNDAGKHILHSYNIRTGVQYLIIPRLVGRVEVGYERQEYRDTRWRNNFLAKLRVVYYF